MGESLFPNEACHPWTPPASLRIDSQIGGRPPNDGRQWEQQCARCGHSLTWVRCWSCGGEGWTEPGDLYELDPLWYDPDDVERCSFCLGHGGWTQCVSNGFSDEDDDDFHLPAPDEGPTWCFAHPLPGRADVAPSTVEWFVVGGPTR